MKRDHLNEKMIYCSGLLVYVHVLVKRSLSFDFPAVFVR